MLNPARVWVWGVRGSNGVRVELGRKQLGVGGSVAHHSTTCYCYYCVLNTIGPEMLSCPCYCCNCTCKLRVQISHS